MADITSVIDYYIGLLIIQYVNQPKAQATIGLLAEAMLVDGVLLDIQNGYNIDTAVGKQLDVLGKYAGVDRTYQSQDFTGYFSFINYSEVDFPPARNGFTNYTNYPLPTGYFLNYFDLIGGNANLSDDNFRILIKLAILNNNSNFSHESIDSDIFSIFSGSVQASSSGNMIMFYFVPSTLTEIIIAAYQKNILPAPMGVAINGLIEQKEAFFGFATYGGYSSLIKGFTTYVNYGIDIGNVLNYGDIVALGA